MSRIDYRPGMRVIVGEGMFASVATIVEPAHDLDDGQWRVVRDGDWGGTVVRYERELEPFCEALRDASVEVEEGGD